MTPEQKAKYGVFAGGWERFDFSLYFKVRANKISSMMKRIKALEEMMGRPFKRKNISEQTDLFI